MRPPATRRIGWRIQDPIRPAPFPARLSSASPTRLRGDRNRERQAESALIEVDVVASQDSSGEPLTYDLDLCCRLGIGAIAVERA